MSALVDRIASEHVIDSRSTEHRSGWRQPVQHITIFTCSCGTLAATAQDSVTAHIAAVTELAARAQVAVEIEAEKYVTEFRLSIHAGLDFAAEIARRQP